MQQPNLSGKTLSQSVLATGSQHSVNLFMRSMRFSYTLLAYAVSLVALVYFILFVSDLAIPITVNSGPYTFPAFEAILINLGLLALFGLQHSLMARGAFKNWLKTYFHPCVERATYCLMTALALGFMCYCWAPIEGTVWQLDSSISIALVSFIGLLGWLISVLATFQLDHFELFGLRQVYCHFTGKPMASQEFKQPGLYKWVRHPMQTGILIGMWCVPTATLSHLMLAGGMTVYIFVGLYFEEKDLLKEFGQTYREYKQRVGKVLPFL
ncbi:MAG: protein-S-isoprenylcysteine O-methyltransferase Ste14 [Paraglaciecola sp.]|jgi:protein-S-isoprenylcysteine O-methyltransferase Ste14